MDFGCKHADSNMLRVFPDVLLGSDLGIHMLCNVDV